MAEYDFIERRIVTGLIISTEYVQKIRKVWNSTLIESQTAKRLAGWCIDYFDQYGKAPGQDIEGIFYEKAKNLPTEQAEDIEQILQGLNDEYERSEKFNVEYLLDQTERHFEEQNLDEWIDEIQHEKEQGNITEAKKLATEYHPIRTNKGNEIDLSDPSSLDDVKTAMTQTVQPVVQYSRQLGEFWNKQLVRDGFVALMGPGKRGKTYMLLDLAIRGARQKSNVAFFQAGDMSKHQQIRRICTYLTKKSDLEEYSGKMFEPVRDCVYNQLNHCEKEERECETGLFTVDHEDNDDIERMKKWIRKECTYDELKEKYKEIDDYIPCSNCKEYWQKQNRWGAVWYKEVDTGKPLDVKQAQKAIQDFYIDKKRRFKLVTYPNDTLTMTEINAQLDVWEKEEDFVVDMVVIDYMDILQAEIYGDVRHQENDKWKKGRALSQKRHCLVVVGTQTDSASYDAYLLGKKHFSEDHRKYTHVTAMYGLNQDPGGKEKSKKMMRLNEIIIREGDYLETNQVILLQNLSRGQPILASMW